MRFVHPWVPHVLKAVYGPVWKEHRSQMNELLEDSDNVLLLHPLDSQRGLAILRSVDPAKETRDSRGVVVAQIFPVKPDGLNSFAQQAEASFAGYRATGARGAASSRLSTWRTISPGSRFGPMVHISSGWEFSRTTTHWNTDSRRWRNRPRSRCRPQVCSAPRPNSSSSIPLHVLECGGCPNGD